MFDKDLEIEVKQGIKEISEFQEENEEEERSSYGFDGLLWLILGFGLVLGIAWGIASLFRR